MLVEPAGFKPNENLAHFFGSIILNMIMTWKTVIPQVKMVKSILFQVTGWTGVLGLSVQLAFLNDILFYCSFWIIGLYSFFACMYRNMLGMMSTLLKLFRGKKFNTIRERDDENEFTVSELYTGILMTTLIIFLLPTIAMYYFYVFISIVI